jgi:hypothetical protein
MMMEKLVERLAGKTEVLGENLSKGMLISPLIQNCYIFRSFNSHFILVQNKLSVREMNGEQKI